MPANSKFNPMPNSAKAARSTLWVQSGMAIAGAAVVVILHHAKREWVPGLVEDDVYRAAAALAGLAVLTLVATYLMRYQWRWLWLLLVVGQVGVMAGAVWAAIDGLSWFVNWLLVIAVFITGLVGLSALSQRVARRWFHH